MRTNLIKVSEKKIPSLSEDTDGMLDMVVAFDTTGSMSAYINAVKHHVLDLIPKLLNSNPNLKIGIVAFGDYCDMESPKTFGKAYQVLPLTNSKSDLISFIKDAKDTHGGDGDEFYELVIKKITEETEWREGATRSVLLIGDCNPHKVGYSYSPMVYHNLIDWREEAKKAANKGIKFDTLTIGSPKDWYKKLSEMTNGISLSFNNSTKTAQVIEASALSRGGSATRAIFEKEMSLRADDAEMSAVYSAYSKEIIK